MNDQQRLMKAVRDAQSILARYVEPGPRDATQTVIDLLAVLDRSDVVEAMERLDLKNGLRSSTSWNG